MILSMGFSIYCLFGYTIPNEYKHKNDSILEKLHPEFDYFNGIWLIGSGLFFTLLLVLLEFPSYKNIYKELRRVLKAKIMEAKGFRNR